MESKFDRVIEGAMAIILVEFAILLGIILVSIICTLIQQLI
jgi:hypothetical protein